MEGVGPDPACARCRLPLVCREYALACAHCGAATSLGLEVCGREDAGIGPLLRRCCYDDDVAARDAIHRQLASRGVSTAAGVWGWAATDWQAMGATATVARRAVAAVDGIRRATAPNTPLGSAKQRRPTAAFTQRAGSHSRAARSRCTHHDDMTVDEAHSSAARPPACDSRFDDTDSWREARTTPRDLRRAQRCPAPAAPPCGQEALPCGRCRMPHEDVLLHCVYCARETSGRYAAAARVPLQSVIGWGVFLAQHGVVAAPTESKAGASGTWVDPPPSRAAAPPPLRHSTPLAVELLDEDDAPTPPPAMGSSGPPPPPPPLLDDDSTTDGYMSARSEDENCDELDWAAKRNSGADALPAVVPPAGDDALGWAAKPAEKPLHEQWAAVGHSLYVSLRAAGATQAAHVFGWTQGDFAALLRSAPAEALCAPLQGHVARGVAEAVAEARRGQMCRVGGVAEVPAEVLTHILSYLDVASSRVAAFKGLRLACRSLTQALAATPAALQLSVAHYEAQAARASPPSAAPERPPRAGRHRRALRDAGDGYDFGRFDAAPRAAAAWQRSTGNPYRRNQKPRGASTRAQPEASEPAVAGVLTHDLAERMCGFLEGLTLQSLTLASPLEAAAAVRVSHVLYTTALWTLTSLHLANCNLGAAGAACLSRHLAAPESVLAVLDVAGNCLGAEGVKTLAASAAASGSLTALSVGGNLAEDAGASALGDMLAANTPLKRLNVAFNSISPVGAELFARGLARNRNLRVLQFSGNCIRGSGLMALLGAVARGQGLTSLYLVGCGLSLRDTPVKDAPEAPASSLRLLDVSENGDPEDVVGVAARWLPRLCEVVSEGTHPGAHPMWTAHAPFSRAG
eukprot:TRINITY_DN5145_c0_g2_i1.p1 TRINITY_DN5145_c0_g2~~TRINITY_DN5145_c0_g2_i1.p1  ORF type:complete len:858 (+),score=130.63 TRINITY_DN5145_c0_g2_i1:116-2689(+)